MSRAPNSRHKNLKKPFYSQPGFDFDKNCTVMDAGNEWKWKTVECGDLASSSALCEYPNPSQFAYSEAETKCYMVDNSTKKHVPAASASNIDECEEACRAETSRYQWAVFMDDESSECFCKKYINKGKQFNEN